MPLEFKLQVVNPKSLDFALQDWRDHILDWTELWPTVGAHLRRAVANQFAEMGALGEHGPWADLDPDYAERKRKRYGDKPILQASEKLRKAAVGEGEGHIEEYEPLKMRFGISSQSVPYALYHQTGYRTRLGTGAGARHRVPAHTRAFVPARRILDFTEDDRNTILQIMLTESQNVARRLGFAIAKEHGFEVIPGEARRMGRSVLESGIPLSGGM